MMKSSPKLRLICDFGPLGAFFIAFKTAGILAATATLIVATLAALLVSYLVEKRIALMPLVSGAVITVFGTLTLILQDETFIKMKPTLVNLLFAAMLLGALYYKKNALRYVLGSSLSLSEEGWRKLSLRWGVFFIFLAALNEAIWRNFPTEFWVDFKVFGMLTLSLAFTMLQVPLIKKHWVEPQETPNP